MGTLGRRPFERGTIGRWGQGKLLRGGGLLGCVYCWLGGGTIGWVEISDH